MAYHRMENMGEGYKKHTDFYNMVKEWTVSDYCTPGIKAEVILDMLISDFIGDLLQLHYNTEKKVTLLLKEYPIQIYEDNNRNAKVDYLVYIEDTKMVLVELKTTNDSFRNEQEWRIQQAVRSGAKSLIDFYNKIVELTGGNLPDRKKYAYSFEEFKRNLASAHLNEEKVRSIQELDYLYVSLDDGNLKLPKQRNMILKDYCENGKQYENFKAGLENDERRELWDSVSAILKACMEKTVY